jgi:hypothetical protein
MRCSNCGAESPDNRFFCGSCGAEMRATAVGEETQVPVNFKSMDIVENGLVLVLVGGALVAIGLLAYWMDVHLDRGGEVVVGPTFMLSEAIPVIGLILLSVGLVVNLGQRFRMGIREAMAFEAISCVISMVVGAILITTVTEVELVDVVRVKTYGYQTDGLLYYFTIGMIPIIMVFVLSIRSRYAWAAVFSVSAALVPLTYLWLIDFFEPQIAALLSCVQIPVLIVLLPYDTRRYYFESTAAHRAEC